MHPSQHSTKLLFLPDADGGHAGTTGGNGQMASEQAAYIEELKKANQEIQVARRAALNLMEDALLSKEALRFNERRMRRQKEAFQAAIGGASLPEALNIIAALVSEETGARTAFYLADEAGAYLHPIWGSGSMPTEYLKQIDGFVIGEDSLACGLAVPTGKPVLTADVFEEPLWKQWVYIAEGFGFRGCWSFPIKTKEKEAVGTLALYFTERREATQADLALTEIATQTAAVILSHHINAQQRALAEDALRNSEERFRLLVTASSESVYRLSPDWKQINFLQGKHFLADTAAAAGSWLEQYVLPEDQPIVQKAIDTAIEHKQIFELEHRVIGADGTVAWVYSRAIPLLSERGEIIEWFGAASNITLRKRAEEQLKNFASLLEQQIAERTQELKESKDLLQSVFDTTLVSMSVLKAVRDESGAITDFRIQLANKELERETGRSDLVGKLYSAEYPGIKQSGLFALMLGVIETGKGAGMEYYYPYEGFHKWYSAMFVKMDDGLVATNLDITERKHAEEELLKNYHLFKQSEDVSRMGSWEYDLSSGTFYWSAGMYRLFDLPQGSLIRPETYLAYVIEEDQPVARKLVSYIREGKGSLQETLRISVRGEIITLKIQAMVLYDERRQATRVLGVDVDISELKRLEQENLNMRLEQQKKLMNAILDAQEEEKRRIAESLHNGVGQMLYAAKLHLDLVEVSPPSGKIDANNQALATSQELLTNAIKETRKVSHELVPVLLKDYGLETAIHDFCKYLQQSTIKLYCRIEDIDRLDPYLEVAVFRISQELINNILKHAAASEASLLLWKNEREVFLEAVDNGKGFEPSTLANRDHMTKSGLGLHSIQDRVKLLNGTFQMQSEPGKGTTIKIRLPVNGDKK